MHGAYLVFSVRAHKFMMSHILIINTMEKFDLFINSTHARAFRTIPKDVPFRKIVHVENIFH